MKMKLHEQRDHYRELASSRKTFIEELKRYVESDKFQADTNVNAGDIILRIREYLHTNELEKNADLGPAK
tara:strand:- start:30 stop:239 length:210 start_codon:yes stop_codon:yes gene_type:complete